ncbi:NAD-P-binding protein [Favolaschia claudopus]|uniref:NAD-P-binding protein n=1 Tax=Favolaschia claudopus TaxID=2862362 RepID=A0AAW0BCG0_9AGAR
MSALRPLFVVAGIGRAAGTGAAVARRFSKEGYSVALIARGEDSLNALSDEIKKGGGEAAPYCIPSYSPDDIASAFTSISAQFPNSHYALRAALFNVGYAVWKPFLEVTAAEVQESLNTNVAAAFAFSRSAILKFKENNLNAENPKRGTLIFTGATASTRGNKMTSAFSIGKFGARALSQSLAKEFGKDGIHVEIMTGAALERSRDQPLSGLSPESIAQAYMYLVNQEKSAWTWELDLRPAQEQW